MILELFAKRKNFEINLLFFCRLAVICRFIFLDALFTSFLILIGPGWITCQTQNVKTCDVFSRKFILASGSLSVIISFFWSTTRPSEVFRRFKAKIFVIFCFLFTFTTFMVSIAQLWTSYHNNHCVWKTKSNKTLEKKRQAQRSEVVDVNPEYFIFFLIFNY